jgi:hypothetical protein
MGNLGIQKPKKSQLINAGATTFGAAVGYQGYEFAAQKLPITKEINLGLFGASILGQAMLKGSGIGKTIASALLIGITINTGFTAAEDYGVLNRLNLSPAVASASELKGLYDNSVDYIQDASFDLAGMHTKAIDLM